MPPFSFPALAERLSSPPTRRQALLLLLATTAASQFAAIPRGWASQGDALTPEAFGARGDGRTDDTDAFLALSAHLNANDGGIVSLRSGATYVVGRQEPGGAEAYLNGLPILHARNVSRFIVRMNGATLKFRGGLKFGSFDPGTGAAKTTSRGHVVARDRADIGYAIMGTNVREFRVSGGKIDGNSRNAVLGGIWGDAGRQCIHYGLAAFGCESVEWADVEIIDSCLDGLVYGYQGLKGSDPAKPLVIRNVTVDRVARNCLSLIGTNKALIENCSFSRAGEAPHPSGTLHSAPASCLDVEAEQAECRNIIVRGCRLQGGKDSYTAFTADSGKSSDILIEDCFLDGVVWTSKPRTVFSRCRINGVFGKLVGGSERPSDNSRVLDCQLSDLSSTANSLVPHAIDLEGAGPGVEISRTTIRLDRMRLNLRGGLLNDVTIEFAVGTDRINNRDYAILADRARLSNVTIYDRIPARLQPADAFYITAPEPGADAMLISPQSKLLWNSWSPGAQGRTGRPS